MNPALRRSFYSIHLWGGLALTLVFVTVAITGAILVLRPQFETTTNPAIWHVTPGAARKSPGELVATARAAHPAARVESVRFYGDSTAPFLVYFTNRDYVHLDPFTGKVLGVRARYGEGWGWVQNLHSFLLFQPSFGEPLMGYHALAFIALVLSGVILWWPASRRALVAGLTLNRKLQGRPWNLNLHRAVGAYAALVVLFSAFSGLPIALNWAKSALYPLTGSRKIAPPTVKEPGTTYVGLDVIATKVAAAFPAARETYIPQPKDGRVACYVIEAAAAHPNARSYAWFNAATGELLRAAPYAEQPAGYRVYYWLMSLHTGVAGGPVWQLILLIGSLAIPVLAYTGIASYLAKRKSARARTGQVPAVAAGVSQPEPSRKSA